MPTHVALLRGINVGGRNRVPMADLRAVVASLGHTDVATYVASGNVVFSTDHGDTAALATDLAAAIAEQLDVQPTVVVLTRDELAQAVTANPFTEVTEPKHLHAVFRADELTAEHHDELRAAEERAAAKGGRDRSAVVDSTVYLHTPDGMGRSKLAEQLNRSTGVLAGTARNWRTVTRLLEMLDA